MAQGTLAAASIIRRPLALPGMRIDKKPPCADAVIRVYDETGSVIDTHEQTGEFKESGEGAESGVV